MSAPLLIRSVTSGRADLRAIVGEVSYGYRAYITASLPDRVYAGHESALRPATILNDEVAVDAVPVPSSAQLLAHPDPDASEGWPTISRKTMARVEVLWLLCEDRHRLLDAELVEPLAHQAALVDHVLASPDLSRVLIADEVGLGKTVEAGLIIKRLQERDPRLKVLYLTEARLVDNVVEELERLHLDPRPRRWTSDRQEARLTPGDGDPMVVASIHRAAIRREEVERSGPWDVIVVDEAHHLTDYSQDGGDPQVRMRLVRALLEGRLTPHGRLILLTGTPHQGHQERFKNILRLLAPSGQESDAFGRVIYRIKDDIRDWDGAPLFPVRRVNEPTTVPVGLDYQDWMTAVHSLLAPGPGASRASAWRRAQALQWCASSPHAGLAYLARLALRSGITPDESTALREAMKVLRPYRGGAIDEPLAALTERLQRASSDLVDDIDEVFNGGTAALARCLTLGTSLIVTDAFGIKLRTLLDLIGANGGQKAVVFAQPIETVYLLKRRLEQALPGNPVAMIVGDQDTGTRRQEISRFVTDPKVRVMVSSRSGGEGINLQVSRHLLHFDVPWNPMEMEQRVGRVHRYGGSQTVIVDTLVLDGSRELDVLRRARARLGRIVQDLDRDRADQLFARTMSLVPLEELQGLMAGEGFGPLSENDQERLDRLVKEGWDRLQVSEREFRDRTATLRGSDRGAATDADLEEWLVRVPGVAALQGWQRLSLREGDHGEPLQVMSPAHVYQLPDGSMGYVGVNGGVGLVSPTGEPAAVRRIGLNTGPVADAVLSTVDAVGVIGPALLLIDRAQWATLQGLVDDAGQLRDGGILMVHVIRRIAGSPDERELDCRMVADLLSMDCSWKRELEGPGLAHFVRSLRAPRPKQKRPAFSSERLVAFERQRVEELRKRGPGDPVKAVFPVAALVIEPA